MGIREATFYNWKKKYGGLSVSELRRLRQLVEVNTRKEFLEHMENVTLGSWKLVYAFWYERAPILIK